ncbi:MAG TPA: DUF1569 domain-containing protein [Terriglobales bacterium]|nr:DUF1569 domain-containing protein [Terriglobales bacterium]
MAIRTLGNTADRLEILDRLGKIEPCSQRRWGRMTAHQAMVHLADSFRVTIGEKPASQARIRVTPIPLPRDFVKWVAMDLPLPWPRGVRTRPEVDQEKGGTRPQTFAADLQELQRLVERFTRRPKDFEYQSHPVFGVMSEAEWQRWGYLHMDHHLRQFGE